jgi:phosphatidylinositol glycan class A protein
LIYIISDAQKRLQVVSTNVGGIPEILPDSMMTLCEPNVKDLMDKLELAIRKFQSGKAIDPLEMHDKMKNMYDWRDVARRTEIVYNLVAKEESPRDLKGKLLR